MIEEHQRHRVVLLLESEAGRIAGSLTAGDGRDRPFEGWLELLSLLDELCAEESARPQE